MVAVMHANGIDVVQDVVLNHVTGAGSVDGSGGDDPAAWNDKFENFRVAEHLLGVGKGPDLRVATESKASRWLRAGEDRPFPALRRVGRGTTTFCDVDVIETGVMGLGLFPPTTGRVVALVFLSRLDCGS